MNTKAQAFNAIVLAFKAVAGEDSPAITSETHVGALAIDTKDTGDFAQIVSDCLALLPNSEPEVEAVLNTEMVRAYPDDGKVAKMDHRAMTIDQFAERIANLPDFEN